jgi:hypothetical protein
MTDEDASSGMPVWIWIVVGIGLCIPLGLVATIMLTGGKSKDANTAATADGKPVAGRPINASSPGADMTLNVPVVHRALGGEPGPDGWCEAESAFGAFSVSLPGQFVDSSVKMPSKTGGYCIMNTVMTKDPVGTQFAVMHTQIYGEHPPGTSTDTVINSFAGRANVEKEEIRVGTLPATRLKVTASGVEAVLIIVNLPTDDYMVAAQAKIPGTDLAQFEKDQKRFFDSFKMTGK